MMALTISMTQDRHAEAHSRREYTPFSAEKSLEDRNIVIYDCGNDREHFNEFFQPAVERYNAKQKRRDRKKDLDYLSALEDGREGYGKGDAHEKTFYHDVLQVGNRNTNGVTRRTFEVDHWRKLKRDGKYVEAASYVKEHLNNASVLEDIKQIYIEVANEILENKDHLYDGILVHGLTIHWDEPSGTPHLDLRYTFYTEGEKTGLDTRVSQRKALAKLGFRTDKEQTALEKFREAIKDRVEEKLIERGYTRDVKNEHRKHQSTVVYEMEQRAKEAETKKVEAEEEAKKVTAEAEKKLKEAEAKEEEIQFNKNIVENEKDILEEDKKKFENDKSFWEKDFENHIRKVDNEVSKVETKLNTQKKQQDKKQQKLDQEQKEFREQIDAWKEWYLDMLSEINPERDQSNDDMTLAEMAEELQEEFQHWEDRLEQQQRVLEEQKQELDELISEGKKTVETVNEYNKTNSNYYNDVFVVRIVNGKPEKNNRRVLVRPLSDLIEEIEAERDANRKEKIREFTEKFDAISDRRDRYEDQFQR